MDERPRKKHFTEKLARIAAERELREREPPQPSEPEPEDNRSPARRGWDRQQEFLARIEQCVRD